MTFEHKLGNKTDKLLTYLAFVSILIFRCKGDIWSGMMIINEIFDTWAINKVNIFEF